MTKQEFIDRNYLELRGIYNKANELDFKRIVLRCWVTYQELTVSDEFVQFERKISRDGIDKNLKVSIPRKIWGLVPPGEKGEKFRITIEKITEKE